MMGFQLAVKKLNQDFRLDCGGNDGMKKTIVIQLVFAINKVVKGN